MHLTKKNNFVIFEKLWLMRKYFYTITDSLEINLIKVLSI